MAVASRCVGFVGLGSMGSGAAKRNSSVSSGSVRGPKPTIELGQHHFFFFLLRSLTGKAQGLLEFSPSAQPENANFGKPNSWPATQNMARALAARHGHEPGHPSCEGPGSGAKRSTRQKSSMDKSFNDPARPMAIAICTVQWQYYKYLYK